MKKPISVAILGAAGAVGREMIRCLQERDLPVSRLLPLGSGRSAGTNVFFQGREIPIEKATPEAFRDCDLVLGAADNAVARAFAPAILEAGALFVDNSSAFRLDPQVPLVVPEINGADAFSHRGIIANPNCCTVIALMAAWPLHRLSPIRAMNAVTYQAVSGAGAAGITELEAQLKGKAALPAVFPHPIARNVIPQIGDVQPNGYTAEEMKLLLEGRKILHAPELAVSCTCVRVPVVRSHSICLQLKFDRPISVEEARSAIAAAPGCRLMDDTARGIYPMPLTAGDQDLVQVGRIRQDLTDEKGLCLWCCADQLRKGAATNAVQIAELLFGCTD